MPRRQRLTPLQARFVEEYLIDLNGAAAAERAGIAPHRARQQAHRWITNDYIAEEISKAKNARSKRTQVTADGVVERLRQIFYTDLTEVVSWASGVIQLRDSAEIPPEHRAALQEVSVSADGRIRVRLKDIIGIATLLARHTGVIPTPGTKKDPLAVDLTLKEDELDLSKFTDEELQQYHDIIGAIIEAQGIAVPSED